MRHNESVLDRVHNVKMETMSFSSVERARLAAHTKLEIYPHMGAWIHPYIEVKEDRVMSHDKLEEGEFLLGSAPILSYHRATTDTCVGLLFALNELSNAEIETLRKRLSPLYPRTEQDRLDCMYRSYKKTEHLAALVSQPEHVIIAFCRCNEFQLNRTGTRFVFLEGSKLNHSCHPNARWELGEVGELIVTSIRLINPGEEVTISYCPGVEAHAGRARRSHLLDQLYFQCHCELCKGRCNFCDKKQERLAVCAKCKKVSYCSRDCQKSDWSQHKTLCVQPASEVLQ